MLKITSVVTSQIVMMPTASNTGKEQEYSQEEWFTLDHFFSD